MPRRAAMASRPLMVVRHVGLLFGITFTSFLVTFAGSYFCGFMTRGFALIAENPGADVWVMDPAVESTELTINIPDSALARVRSVDGVLSATPLALATADARFPDGRFQSLQLIGVDDATRSNPNGGERISYVLLRPENLGCGRLRPPSRLCDEFAPLGLDCCPRRPEDP
jgi:hypothetical protein